MAHSIQLVVNQMRKMPDYTAVVNKGRAIVRKVKISSKATEKLIAKCGKTVVVDCPTRWNSTLLMVNRLIAVRIPLTEVMNEMNCDALLVSEWSQLSDLSALLQPFAEQTDLLQKDSLALCQIIPAVLDLRYHLLDSSSASLPFASGLLEGLNNRFDRLLNECNVHFEVSPAAACLMDPSNAHVLMNADFSLLMSAAKAFIITQVQLALVIK